MRTTRPSRTAQTTAVSVSSSTPLPLPRLQILFLKLLSDLGKTVGNLALLKSRRPGSGGAALGLASLGMRQKRDL